MIRSNRKTDALKAFALVVTTVLLLAISWAKVAAEAQNVAQDQLQSLVPDEQDLQGFSRIRPAGELPEGWAPNVWSPKTQTMEVPISPAVVLNDDIETVAAPTTSTTDIGQAAPGGYSQIRRVLYSQDGTYRMEIKLILNTSRSSGLSLRQAFPCQAFPTAGTFDGPEPIGEESWVFPTAGSSCAIMFRAGQIMAFISGDMSASAARHQMRLVFPRAAVEAAAYQILLRGARQAKLTGVSFQTAQLTVNGHALPKNALQVAGQIYVPVQAFVKAMGMATHWDSKTGALTLSGPRQKTIALTAGSTAAQVGGTAAAALTVPVLKQAGQPVMTLEDLLTLTGGRITGRSGNVVQVKA